MHNATMTMLSSDACAWPARGLLPLLWPSSEPAPSPCEEYSSAQPVCSCPCGPKFPWIAQFRLEARESYVARLLDKETPHLLQSVANDPGLLSPCSCNADGCVRVPDGCRCCTYDIRLLGCSVRCHLDDILALAHAIDKPFGLRVISLVLPCPSWPALLSRDATVSRRRPRPHG